MLEFVVGSQRNPHVLETLREQLADKLSEGTVYIGYPIIASVEGPVSVDALLCSQAHGLVVFDFKPFDRLEEVLERQNDLHAAVFRKLQETKGLRTGRGQLAVEIHVVTVSPDVPEVKRDGDAVLANPDHVAPVVSGFPSIPQDLLSLVNASIERVSNLKPQGKRPHLKNSDSRGGVIDQIEKQIANLDSWQKKAAIEAPDGPQRIRGLAGSGKTIVLALKAAYLHAQNPEWDIVVTFHTRSLYQQFRDLITRFSFEQMNDEPNWDKLRILHAWGSPHQPGVYSSVAVSADHEVRDFGYGKHEYGYHGAFQGVCAEVVETMGRGAYQPIFDIILIDEAQDLPPAFFEMVYLATRPPHRITWAYDEMQNLTQDSMPPLEELFGNDEHGNPRIEALRADAEPREDIILPVCYRNTHWSLSVAHALGFGIYRQQGPVQFYDDPNLWSDIGYEVVRGRIQPESHVVLRRRKSSYPEYFEDLLKAEDAVTTHVFSDPAEQAEWLAEQISINVEKDELRLQDILVIFCDAVKQKSQAAPVIRALGKRGLSAHLAGVTSSVDTLFRDGSIALSGIYRAKGNEAPMVYILHAEYGVERGWELIKRRNILFTAITRSRAWVRLSGIGSSMETVIEEVNAVVAHDYQLDFTVPSADDLDRLRRIHRDMPDAEKNMISRAEREFAKVLQRVENGELPPEVVSADLLERIRKVLEEAEES